MVRPRIIDPAAVAACQAAGMAQKEAAEKLGISVDSVRKYWAKAPTRGNPTKSAYREQIAAGVAAGESDRVIAERLGVAVSTVNRQRRALKDQG